MTGASEHANRGEELRCKWEESRRQEQERRRRWITYHRERRPVYPPAGEPGAFVGVFGFRGPGGTREFPYYQTPSGVYFYEASTPRFLGDTESVQRKTKRIDADRWRREGVKMFTPEGWLARQALSPLDPEKESAAKGTQEGERS